jgi:glutathione reductase (NADPH)
LTVERYLSAPAERFWRHLFQQRGSFVDAHSVRGHHVVTAAHILIATGGRPWIADIPGSEHAITSNEAFDLGELPGRILIVGGGYIACEFAGIFNGLGASVTQSYRGDAVLRVFDHEVREFIGEEMEKKGICLLLQSEVERIDRQPGSADLNVQFADGRIRTVDQVMFATGRVPNVASLDIQNSGVEVSPDGRVRVNEFSRTNVDHIYAVGDVTSR